MAGELLEPILRLLRKGPPELLANSVATARLVERMPSLLPGREAMNARDLLLGALAHGAGKATRPGELFAKHRFPTKTGR